MKTAIKLTLIYFLMQILAAITATPICLLYIYFADGVFDSDKGAAMALAPTLVLGFIYMVLYLWRGKYLTGDKNLYSITSASFLGWCLPASISLIFIVSTLASALSFLPNWLENSFETLLSGWMGIIAVAVLGPILEELLFRGAITKVLLAKYSPTKAIILSGLVFGIFHINPAQVLTACLIGFLLAWIYYKTKSLIPCILIHIFNNSLAVYLSCTHPEIEEVPDLMGTPEIIVGLVVSILVLFFSLKKMNQYKLSDTNTNMLTEV